MNRLEQLQPPLRLTVEVRRHVRPADRRRRAAEILLDILDTAGTPEKDGRP